MGKRVRKLSGYQMRASTANEIIAYNSAKGFLANGTPAQLIRLENPRARHLDQSAGRRLNFYAVRAYMKAGM